MTLGQLGTITYIYVLYFISLEEKINVTLETFHFMYLLLWVHKTFSSFLQYGIQYYNSSMKGVCPKFPLAAIDFRPETNFFAAFKTETKKES